MYAVVESGGKQYKVEKGTSLLVDRLSAKEGDKVALRPVMFRDKEVVAEPKELEKVKVEATVAEHLRGPKIKVFKYKPKKGYRRRAGHRSELTRLEVTEVKLVTRRNRPRKNREKKPQKTGCEKGGRGRWLIRKDSAPAATAANPTPRCSGSRSSPARRSPAARSSSASAAPASGPARAPASAATTRSSRPAPGTVEFKPARKGRTISVVQD